MTQGQRQKDARRPWSSTRVCGKSEPLSTGSSRKEAAVPAGRERDSDPEAELAVTVSAAR
jgi:hypothetical protein